MHFSSFLSVWWTEICSLILRIFVTIARICFCRKSRVLQYSVVVNAALMSVSPPERPTTFSLSPFCLVWSVMVNATPPPRSEPQPAHVRTSFFVYLVRNHRHSEQKLKVLLRFCRRPERKVFVDWVDIIAVVSVFTPPTAGETTDRIYHLTNTHTHTFSDEHRVCSYQPSSDQPSSPFPASCLNWTYVYITAHTHQWWSVCLVDAMVSCGFH